MKTITLTLVSLAFIFQAKAQNFNKYMSEARSAYAAKKLDNARFSMQQMLQELDVMAGKDVLKLLPTKLDALQTNTANDNVSGNSGFAGIMIHRDYGAADKTAEIEVIGNSPLMASVNAILSLPFTNSGGNQKTIKVDGYKALLQKNTDSETNKSTYEVQIPLNSSLLTLKVNGADEDMVLKLANTIPVSKLASLLQ
jgi:hypothetical protein